MLMYEISCLVAFFYQVKVFLEFKLERNPYNSHWKINITIYFENQTIGLHVIYILKTHVKFHSNMMLIIIRT